MHDHILIGQLASFNQGKCQVMILICASDSETDASASIEIVLSLPARRVGLRSPLQTLLNSTRGNIFMRNQIMKQNIKKSASAITFPV